MNAKGANGVGRFSVAFEVANHGDLVKAREGIMKPSKVRRTTIASMVDPGATWLVLPEAIAKQLGLRSTGKVKVSYADKRTATRAAVEEVYVELQGRHGVFTAVVEPKRQTALIGAVVLEDLDFLVDCTQQRLVPRDSRYTVNELE